MIWIYVLIGAIIFILMNWFYFKKSLSSLETDLRAQKWFNLPKKEYVRYSYNFIADHYVMQKHAWARFWKNFYYQDCWKDTKSIPCHMYAVFYQHCLRQRFPKEEVKMVYTNLSRQKIHIHFYNQVLVDGKWLNVDSWGKKRGVPFGETIHMQGWKR